MDAAATPPEVTERIPVRFAGNGSGTAELSWGQQTVWRGIEARGAPIILTGIEKLPETSTVAGVADTLRYLMSRHQSLRTRFRFTGAGRPQQEVSSSGEIFLDIYDADAGADPEAVAKALEQRYELADRDYVNDWPVRMAVIRHRGVPAYLVRAMCHLVTDGFGALVMLSDLRRRDPVTGGAAGPVTAMEPLEQAQWQASPAGQRQSRAAQRHWERLLRTVPPRRLPPPRGDRGPRHWQATHHSPAAYLATQAIAARLDSETAPVLLAAFAVAMSKVTGINPTVPRVMVNNRFRTRFADVVAPVAQTCPCAIDVAGVTFGEAVARAARASVAAYKYAYFEPARIRELVAAVGKERGEDIDVGVVYNDRRFDSGRVALERAPDAAGLRAASGGTTLRLDSLASPIDDFHVHVVDAPGAIEVLVFFDAGYVSAPDVAAVLTTMEEVLVEAAVSRL
jgi:condensation domain-containing protein